MHLQVVNYHGDKAPTSKQAKKDYPKNHFGHKHKRPATMCRLSWRKRIPDMLHILLRVIAHLYWHTCQKHCLSPEAIEKLHEFMKADLSVTVNSKKRLTKNQDQANIGNEKKASLVLSVYCFWISIQHCWTSCMTPCCKGNCQRTKQKHLRRGKNSMISGSS